MEYAEITIKSLSGKKKPRSGEECLGTSEE
jgi:hypothetical protein